MEREMTIEEVRKICGESFRNHLDNYVQALLYFKANGERVYWDFNGHILHSENITPDLAYIEVTGKPKPEREMTIEEEQNTKKI